MPKKVVLACKQCKSRNYTTNKTEKIKTERLEINKYCKVCGEHTTHLESK